MTKQKSRGYMLVTGALFIVAVALLLFSTIGGARAAFVYSQNYQTYIHTEELSTNMSFKGEIGDYFTGSVTDWLPGKLYKGSVSAVNDGDIAQYMRVVIHRYWIDPDTGKKDVSLDPSLIELKINSSKWGAPENVSRETIILYSNGPVNAGGSLEILSGVTINKSVSTYVETTAVSGNFTYTYLYDGVPFGIDIEVDGVQAHNGDAAMQSAWGR